MDNASTPTTLTGGDVVCKEVGSLGGKAFLSCSQIAWCAARRCVTSGRYSEGDVLLKANNGEDTPVPIGVASSTEASAGLPEDATISLIDVADSVQIEPFRNAGKRLLVHPDFDSSTASHLKGEVRDPLTGRMFQRTGVIDKNIDSPSEGVVPVDVKGRLAAYFQGGIFRMGTHAVCVYNGVLETPDKEYAACFESSRICKYHPEMCSGRGGGQPE